MGEIIHNIGAYGVGCNKEQNLYHIFVVSKSHIKVFFTEDGTWTEDIKARAESSDFQFVHETFCEIIKDKDIMLKLEASLLF